jgi:hypothetical protein
MKKLLLALLMGFALGTPIAGFAAPDEAQKQLIQRAQESKRKLDAAQAASGAQRQKLMQEHMTLMQEMMKQMQTAKPREGMTTQQMREWIDEHLKLMEQMMGQMMGGQHMMMGGPTK